MEESIYKHNYEYLSIEEAKAIVNGTFVQGTTNIGGRVILVNCLTLPTKS